MSGFGEKSARWICLLLGSAMVLSIMPSCKKGHHSAPDVATSDLRKMMAHDTLYEQGLKVQESLKPGEFVITFDDGPVILGEGACPIEDPLPSGKGEEQLPEKVNLSPDTADLVDFLIAEKIPATFFVVALKYRTSRAARCVIDRMVGSPHLLLANHTWSHISSRVDPKNCNATHTAESLPEEALDKQRSVAPLGQEGDEDAYSKFITEEVKAAHCLIHERIQEVLEPKQVQEYPLFYRPPGGYWTEEDKRLLLKETSLESYLGPVPWNFGGDLKEVEAADYACWDAGRWWEGASEAEREAEWEEKKRQVPLFLLQRLKEGMDIEQACSELYMKSIMRRPPQERRGIILLHDEHSQTVSMFIRYLYPALQKEGFRIIPLDEVPYYAEQLQKIRQSETVFSGLPYLKSPCAVPVNYCTCCSQSDRSCCNGATPPPAK